MNIKSRIEDPKINQFTSHQEVKKILDERFLLRKESRVGARVVPGGTTGNSVRDTRVEDDGYRSRQDPKRTTGANSDGGRHQLCRSQESCPRGGGRGDSVARERK
jgi:putative transposase